MMKTLFKIGLYISIVLFPTLVTGQYFNNKYPVVDHWGGVGFNSIENNDGYMMVGVINSTFTNRKKIHVIQTDFEGNVLFEKAYGDTLYSYYAGFQGSLQKLLNTSGYIMFGSKQDTLRHYDLLYRFNDAGDLLWTKQLGDSTAIGSYIGYSVKETLDGGFICAGTNGNSTNLIWLVKTDSLGNEEWEQHYGAEYDNYPTSIAVCSDGGYIFTGYTKNGGVGLPNSNIRVTKIDSLGNVIFNKYVGDVYDYDIGYDVIETQDGGYAICGTYSTIERSFPFIYKLNNLGDSLWLNTYTPFSGNSNSNTFRSILELVDGSLVAAGFNVFTDSITIGRYHGLIIKTTANGTPIWHKEYNNASDNSAGSFLYDIRSTNDKGFICSGIASAPQEIWLLKIDSMGCEDTTCYNTTAVSENTLSNDGFKVYPNPSVSRLYVEQENAKAFDFIELFDVTGKRIIIHKLEPNLTSIDVSSCSKGVYIYHLVGEGEIRRAKLIIQ